MGNKVSRRGFMKSAAAAGAMLAAGGLVAGCATGAPQKNTVDEMSWDKEVDAVVIGSGTGLYTALKLHDLGSEVLVLEKSDKLGGSTAISGSVVWAVNNALMQEEGIVDSREEGLEYIRIGSGDTYSPELAEAFIDIINETCEEVSRLAGVKWMMSKGRMDYRSELPGGKGPGRAIHPVVEKEGGSPAGLLGTALIAAIETAGIETMLMTPATRLITRALPDGGSEVIGVTAQAKSGAINIRTRKGVVLAAGGFDWNEEMLTHYVRGPVYGSWGVPQAVGDGQKMAMAIGADMHLMTGAWWSPGHKIDYKTARDGQVPSPSAAINDCIRRGAICVNKKGMRFMNEASDYDSLGRVFCSRDCGTEVRGWAHLPAYLICDATTVAKYPMGKSAKPGEPGAVYTPYDSIEALAVGVGVDPAALRKTVDEFNTNAADGLDPEFGRGQDEFGQEYLRVDFDYEGAKRTLAPLESPPFYASEIVPVVLGTMGGVHVNAKAQAQHVDGSVIGRLYAQGNNAGVGVGGEFYAGAGATVAPGLAFGDIAARDLSTLETWA